MTETVPHPLTHRIRPDSAPFDFSEMARALLRQWGVILATILVVNAAVLVLLLRQTPVYDGIAMVVVGPRDAGVFEVNAPQTMSPAEAGRVDTEVELIRSSPVLLRVIEEFDLTRDTEFGVDVSAAPAETSDGAVAATLERLSRAVTVTRAGLSYAILITVRSESPVKAAAFANAIADAYLAEQLAAKTQQAVGIAEAVHDQLGAVGIELRAAEARLEAFIAANRDTIATAIPESGAIEAITGLIQRLADAGPDLPEVLQALRDEVALTAFNRDPLVQLFELQTQAAALRSAYGSLAARERSLVSESQLQTPDSWIAAPALVPTEAAGGRMMILALAAMASIILGLGLALLRNRNAGITEPGQLERILGVSTLAILPKLAPASLASHGRIVVDQPLSAFAESFRLMRARLSSPTGDVMLVCSANPGEGRTLIATSFARSLAISGKRVLLVDGDLRNPSIAKIVADPAEARWPDGQVPMVSAGKPALIEDRATGSKVLALAPRTGSVPEAVFDDPDLRQMVSATQDDFDAIVVDTSALLDVADARFLLRFATTILLVVRAGKTTPRQVRAALDDILRLKPATAVVATVLNASAASSRRAA